MAPELGENPWLGHSHREEVRVVGRENVSAQAQRVRSGRERVHRQRERTAREQETRQREETGIAQQLAQMQAMRPVRQVHTTGGM